MATKKRTTKPAPQPINTLSSWLALGAKVEAAILARCQYHKNPATTLTQIYDAAASAVECPIYAWLNDTLRTTVRGHVQDLISSGRITKVGKRYTVPNIGAEAALSPKWGSPDPTGKKQVNPFGFPSDLACPECGGISGGCEECDWTGVRR